MQRFQELIENARRKLEVHMDAAMPCKKSTKSPTSSQETEARSDEFNEIPKNTKDACMVEAHESTRKRLDSSLPKDHEDHIAGKGYNRMTHYHLVHKISDASSDENSGCESSSGQGMEEARNDSGLAVGESQKQKKEVIQEAQKDIREVLFATLMGMCHLKNAESEPKFQKS